MTCTGHCLFEFHPLERRCSTAIAQVSLVKWWMRHYDSATAKRHYLYSNSHVVRSLDRGRLHMRGWPTKTKVKTCEKYRDHSGKLRYKGTANLKQTEWLALGPCTSISLFDLGSARQPEIVVHICLIF